LHVGILRQRGRRKDSEGSHRTNEDQSCDPHVRLSFSKTAPIGIKKILAIFGRNEFLAHMCLIFGKCGVDTEKQSNDRHSGFELRIAPDESGWDCFARLREMRLAAIGDYHPSQSAPPSRP
jgi:hypothetical protein